MHWNVDPCVIYQRLRPGAPEASKHARRTVWPLADELVEHKGYTVCGLYGDSEFAPPFCGASEIRPGFESALSHAREIAGKLGKCTVIVGDASPIGDGDPFLPAYVAPDSACPVHISLVNFHLKPHVIGMPLRAAWRCFDRNAKIQTQPQILGVPLDLVGPAWDTEIFIRLDPERLLAGLYVANPNSQPITLKWAQLLRRLGANSVDIQIAGWRDLNISSGCGAHLLDIHQGELPWVRQVRLKSESDGRKRLGSVHLTPSDMTRHRLPLIWEGRGRNGDASN